MVLILKVINYLKVTIKIVIFLVFLNTNAKAQNLIKNGDFEQSEECPTKPGQLELCSNWSIPNHSTPDLLKRCPEIKNQVNVPYNGFGYQEPYSGDAYIGIVLIHFRENYKNYREYIQGEIVEKLTVGKVYRISFYVSWSDYDNFFCDRLGYFFTNSKIEAETTGKVTKKKKRKKKPVDQEPVNNMLPKSNGYVSLNFEVIKDRENWHKVEFTYQAKGGERYLTLGLFGDNATEDDVKRYESRLYGKPSNLRQSVYFFIDDVSVVPVDGKIDYTHEHSE